MHTAEDSKQLICDLLNYAAVCYEMAYSWAKKAEYALIYELKLAWYELNT